MKISQLILIPIVSVCTLFTLGCQERTQVMLIVNTSASNFPKLQSLHAKRTINRVIYRAKPDDLTVVVTAKHPIFLPLPTRQLDSQKVLMELAKARAEQKEKESFSTVNIRTGGLTLKEKTEFWGWGTDHAAAFRVLNDHRQPKTSTLIVVLTDGWNEEYPFEQVETELEKLFKKGPTRLIILGLSQRIIDEKQQLSVLELWHKTLLKLGIVDLAMNPQSPTGFYATSSLDLPRQFLNQ